MAGVTEAVALFNGDPDSQAAALLRLEKRQVSLSDLGLLVDPRGAWLDLSFRDKSQNQVSGQGSAIWWWQ